MNKKLMPNAPVCTVRADTSIGDCVRLLRNQNTGAIVVLSDTSAQDIVGIFTERDVVKNIELINRGDFWEMPVRTVMTTGVRMVKVGEIANAPRMMAEFNIRHLPVISVEKGRTHVVGVISMRDIFRIAMESIDYNLEKLYQAPTRLFEKKLVGVFSEDAALTVLINKSASLSSRTIMLSPKFNDTWSISDYTSKFDAILVDFDEMDELMMAKALAYLKQLSSSVAVVVVFNPTKIPASIKTDLHHLSEAKHIHLLSKPISFGLLYEKFIKDFAHN